MLIVRVANVKIYIMGIYIRKSTNILGFQTPIRTIKSTMYVCHYASVELDCSQPINEEYYTLVFRMFTFAIN